MVSGDLKYDESGNFNLSQLRGAELASDPGAGRRTSGISSDRGCEEETDLTRERRNGAFYRICGIDDADGICNVQRYHAVILKRK